ncbi:MAG: hypothetical protein R8G66_14940 [Cytophagales bacterium]|nr:hypothetical protein [Cytophagales bacterium]
MAAIQLIHNFQRGRLKGIVLILFLTSCLFGFDAFSQESAEESNNYGRAIELAAGFSISPPYPRLPGGFLSMGFEQSVKKNFALTSAISWAYMQKEDFDIEDFTEKVHVINLDFGVNYQREFGLNVFGVSTGPVLRYLDRVFIGNVVSRGDQVLDYDVDTEGGFFLGYHLGGYWDYRFNDKASIGIRYRSFLFFDRFSNQTLGVSIKRRF